ncbi:recombinase family protein [Streptomyces sp. NPDC048172]|uniref:recombinase family protein n=1 Tax=Streptomyces sp. NPDC048172 TaxID=3365505 RepID=UPI0037212509
MTGATDPAKLCDLYLRRSTLQDDKSTLKAHEKDLRERAKRDGLTVRKVWKEELSAFKSGVVRDEFDKAIAAVIAGEVRHLLVWKLSRLSRRGMGQVGLVLDQFEEKGARLISHMDGLDSSVPQHRGLFAWLAEQARSESFNTSMHTRATKAEKKLKGAWPGGQPPFGLRVRRGRKSTEHHPKEYEPSRLIADLLLAGKSAEKIADEMNTRGWRTRRGGLWRSSSITQLAHSPAWAGLMPVHERYTDSKGRERWRSTDEPLRGPDGEYVRVGKSVITVGERVRILAQLRSRTSNSLASGRRGKPAAQSLLSGFLKCGRCLGPMTKGGKQYRCYRRVNLGKSACQGMSVQVVDMDRVIEIAFIKQVKSLPHKKEVFQELAARWQAYEEPENQARRAELTASLDDATSRRKSLENARYVKGQFSDADGEQRYDELHSSVTKQISDLKSQIAEITSVTEFLATRDYEDLRNAWLDADQEKARELLGVVMKSVTLLPPPSTGPRTLHEVLTRSCFHWHGEKRQPLKVDGRRTADTTWPFEYLPEKWTKAA